MSSDVVVVGGGLAGLSCAIALAQHGRRCEVLEAGFRLGGRAQSWLDPVTGDSIDLGPHILLSTYPNMLKMLKILGTDHLVEWQKDGMIRQVEGTRNYDLAFSPLPAPFHFLPSLLKNRRVSLSELVTTAPLLARAVASSEEDLRREDNRTALELLRELGVCERVIDEMWRFVGLAILNLPLEECSAASLLRFVKFLAGRKDYRVGFAKGGLGELFADQSERFLEKAGSSVRLRTPVSRVQLEKGPDGKLQVAGLELAAGGTVRAKTYVFAVPPGDLASLLPAEFKNQHGLSRVDRFDPCPYLSIYLWFDRKVTTRAFWARTYNAQDYNCDFYDLTAFREGWQDRPSVIASNVIYSSRLGKLSDEEVIAKTIEELAETAPDVRSAKLVHSVVNHVPMAIHCPRPGTESSRPGVRVLANNTYLAGDWVDTGFPSSMESACRGGFLAAEAMLADAGTPVAKAYSSDLGELGAFVRFNGKMWDQIFAAIGRTQRPSPSLGS